MTTIASRGARLIALILIIIIGVYAISALVPVSESYPGKNPLMKDGAVPRMVAHRGGCAEFPENTLEAFYNAYSVDKNVIMETDVNLTKDGVLILLHNERLDATTNVTGLASDWNYTDLIAQRVDFGYDNPTKDTVLAGERAYFTVDGERRLPTDVTYPDGVTARDGEIYLATTFEELLVAFPDNIISVEIKQGGKNGIRAAEEAVRLIEKHGAFDRVILTSFRDEVTLELKKFQRQGIVPDTFMRAPGILGVAKFYALTILGLGSLYSDNVAILEISMGELGLNFATEKLIRTAREHNVAICYWTINDEADMRYLIELGADAIMTDSPTLMKKVFDEYK